MKPWKLIWPALALLGALLACAGPGAGGPPTPEVVTSADGQAQLTIPPGALPADAKLADIRIVPLPALAELGAPLAVYQLEPDGLVWAAPVTVTVRLPGLLASVPAVGLLSGGQFEPLDGAESAYDTAANQTILTATVSHFSQFVVADGYFRVSITAPKKVRVGQTFEATIEIARTAQTGGLVTTLDADGQPQVVILSQDPLTGERLVRWRTAEQDFRQFQNQVGAYGSIALTHTYSDGGLAEIGFPSTNGKMTRVEEFVCRQAGPGTIVYYATFSWQQRSEDYAAPDNVFPGWMPLPGINPVSTTTRWVTTGVWIYETVECVDESASNWDSTPSWAAATATIDASTIVTNIHRTVTPSPEVTVNHQVTSTIPSDTPPPPTATVTPSPEPTLSPSPDLAPRVTKFLAEFSAPVRSTFYSVSATDPTGGGLTYAWTNTNTCGTFAAKNEPIVQWLHPDEAGGCPVEDIHPGTITVTITGAGGQVICTYSGGSAPGDAAQCVKAPPP